MPRRGDRGGTKTRAHIAAVATELFLARSFDEVTIAEVAAAAGVSKVTVFTHFERKEDLLLDRLPEAVEIVRSAARDGSGQHDPVGALHQATLELAKQRHPLSGLSEGIEPFLRTLANSPALIARLRAFEHEIETEIANDIDANAGFAGNGALVAALVVAAYRTVAVRTITRRLAGADLSDIAAKHQRELNQAFDTVAHGVQALRGDPLMPERR